MFILEDAGVSGDTAPAVNPNAGGAAEEGGLLPNDPNGEGTTPEEVGKVLKSSGMNVPDLQDSDEEEGDDPDKPAAEEPEEKPEGDDPDKEEPKDKKEQPEKAKEAPQDEAADSEDKYSFTVIDANGVTFKITADADIEDVLKEFDPKNNGQIIKILDQLREVKEQKSSDDDKNAAAAVKAERAEAANKLLDNWTSEAKDLQAQKRIADGDDGQKRIDSVYKYMAAENEKRMAAGRPTLNSFEDALDKLEAKENREAKVEQDKKDKEEARKKGGLVGGSSAPASSGSAAYKPGSARSVNEALRHAGLLK
jgi:hypothetical protein